MYSSQIPLIVLQISAAFQLTLAQLLTPPPEDATSTSTSSSSSRIFSATTSVSTNSTTESSASATNTAIWPDLGQVDSCVTECANLAVSRANCTSIVDVTCYCVSEVFKNAVVSCVTEQCPDQLENTIDLAEDFCAVSSISISFASTGQSTVSSTASTSISTDSTTTETSATTTPGAATALASQNHFIIPFTISITLFLVSPVVSLLV